jgi:hypothetical protein
MSVKLLKVYFTTPPTVTEQAKGAATVPHETAWLAGEKRSASMARASARRTLPWSKVET